MKNKVLPVLLSAAIFLASAPAFATLTNSNTSTTYSSKNGSVHVYSALITAASNDTTDPADSDALTNLDGTISDLCASVKATNQTGSSPTLEVQFLGAHSSSGPWFVLKGAQDQDDPGTLANADSGTLDISTASTTNVAIGICGSQFGIKHYPPYNKVRIDVGGSSTPGWTGVASLTVFRMNLQAMIDNVIQFGRSVLDRTAA